MATISQGQVYSIPSQAINGQVTNKQNLHTLTPVPRAGNGGVIVGRFVWFSTAPSTGNQNGDTASQNIYVRNVQVTVDTQPDAFAYAIATGVIYDTDANSTMVKKAGDDVECAIAGDFFVKLINNSVQGNKVFASITDGTLQAGASGATIAGYIETSYKITLGATAGSLAVMSKLFQA